MRWRVGTSLTPLQKFSLITFVLVLVVTTAACGVSGWLLVRRLVAHDAALAGGLARLLFQRSLPASLFVPTAVADPSAYARAIADIAESADVVQVILYDAEARVLWSDDATLVGRRFAQNRELRAALSGVIEAKIIRPGKEEHEALRSFRRIEEIYLPVRYDKDGPVVAVLEIYRCAPAFFAVVDRALALVWLMGGGGGVLLYATLFAAARLGLVQVGQASLDTLAVERSAGRRSEEAVRRMNDTLEAEAKRIAHEVHDGAGQLLTVAQLVLADVARDMTPAAREGLSEVSSVLDEIAEELRGLAHEIRPTILDHLGLIAALEILAKRVMRRTALTIRVEGVADTRLPPIVETALYRIVQEAVTNVVKHSRALSVIICVAREPGNVRCSIRDDGVGFDAVAVSRHTGTGGLGLLGIANRVEALVGTLEIIATPGQGTTLLISIPLS